MGTRTESLPSRSIHPGTAVGPVHLTVRYPERCMEFYARHLGMRSRSGSEGRVHLGAGGPDLIVLWPAGPDAPDARGAAGLYHLALLVPSRRDLAQALARLAATRTPLHGASDHRVSEALYLADPEGNGIELYRDRPRSEWKFDGGEVVMDIRALDLDSLLDEARTRDEPGTSDEPGMSDEAGTSDDGLLPRETALGHLHLKASSLPAIERLYVGVLGFEPTMHAGSSAVFLSAGGYHHHLAFNVWAGVGAPPAPPGAPGLRQFAIRVPGAAERRSLVDRLVEAGVAVQETEWGASFLDPSGHRVVIDAAGGESIP